MNSGRAQQESPAAQRRTGLVDRSVYNGGRRIKSGRQGYQQPKSMRELMIAIGWNPDDTTGDGRVS